MLSRVLTSVVEATQASAAAGSGPLQRLATLGDWEALAYWLGLEPGAAPPDRQAIVGRLSRDIAHLDELVGRQLDAVLHHAAFQALEAAWLGLERLTEQVTDEDDNVKIRLLDVSWKELAKDLERAIEFDQSQLFRRVYSAEFGSPGGEPFGVLLGNYEIQHRRSREHLEDDVSALRGISQVAAAAFAPFVAGAHPSLLGLDSFRDLERPIDLSRTFKSQEYTAWNSLRRQEDVRFVGLTLPRILMRRPWGDDPVRTDGFVYRENVSAADGSAYLWGSAAWAFCEVLIRTFIESGWLAGIRGVERDSESGGLVTSLTRTSFGTDRGDIASKGGVEVQLTDEQEKELGDLGFIALTHCAGTSWSAFYGNQSIQSWGEAQNENKVKTIGEVNAKLSSMLQYMFSVSRFAHYLKVIARDKVGSFTQAEDIERILNDWLVQYATSNEGAPTETQAKFPLRQARVEVRQVPGRPGVYQTVVHLQPHYQLDQMTSSVKLVTELFAGRDI